MSVREMFNRMQEDGEVVAYVVYKEHTLGYLFKTNGEPTLGVLRAMMTKGAPFTMHDDNQALTVHDFKYLRKATTEDFNEYRVVSNGYDI